MFVRPGDLFHELLILVENPYSSTYCDEIFANETTSSIRFSSRISLSSWFLGSCPVLNMVKLS